MSKVEEIQNYLQQNQIDAAFVTTPDNVFYVSGFKSNPHERLLGVMVFKNADPFLICPQMEIPDAKAAGWSYEVIGHQDTENSMEVLAQAIKDKFIPEFNTINDVNRYLNDSGLSIDEKTLPDLGIKC